jgi:hypothetical protein
MKSRLRPSPTERKQTRCDPERRATHGIQNRYAFSYIAFGSVMLNQLPELSRSSASTP